jgi:hypothetical protein
MENNMASFENRKPRPTLGRIISRPADTDIPEERSAAGTLRYAFIGLSSGAGATTLCFAYAEYLAQIERAKHGQRHGQKNLDSAHARTVTVLEVNDSDMCRGGWAFDRIGCDRRFAGREFDSCYAIAAAGRSIRGIRNLDSGINWLLRIPDEAPVIIDQQDYLRMIAGAPGDIVLCDISGTFGSRLFGDGPLGRGARADFFRRLLIDFDKVFVIIDPLPSAMMADTDSLELFKELEVSGTDVTYVINKMNAGVNKREQRAFLRLRKAIEIPYLAPVPVYTAEYNCCTVYAMPKLSVQLKSPFEQMNYI